MLQFCATGGAEIHDFSCGFNTGGVLCAIDVIREADGPIGSASHLHAGITPDNNAAERAVKPFVIGRKNWMMSGSPAGAAASCAIFSLVETAKENGLEPFSYLHYIFQRVPRITSPAGWDELLPGNLTREQLAAALPSPLKHS
ncbi:transposase domain-containing protein [Alkalispirochaeta sphaeroplastigenens]|uniref:transposase domain-containing protein n=1 Tax=Alkalispirochaeta sphaeroplastigenens TaxID=1187066 RepID=UPI00268A7704